MPFPERTLCQCDVCEHFLARRMTFDTCGYTWHATRLEESAHRFMGEREAARIATAEGWYVDARTVRCPDHHPGHEVEDEQV